MTEASQRPIVTVPESELLDWYDAGWTFVGPADAPPDHSVIRWDLAKRALAPFNAAAHVASGRVEG